MQPLMPLPWLWAWGCATQWVSALGWLYVTLNGGPLPPARED